jgi:hypothetical protein
MRKKLILIGDVVAYVVLVGWFKLGLWIDLLGFSTYHSRGDVWLATPPAALDFQMGLICTAAFLFGAGFLLSSCLIFVLGGPRKEDQNHTLYNIFYGNKQRLLVKYLSFLSSSILVPLAVRAMWKIHPARQFTIFSAFGIMLTVFIVVVIIADLMLSRSTPRQITAGNLRTTP